ncbi:hypothetical protein J4407_01370 [Candidatus Pacearchaeota archaeon]|nr:hypothetical protein [Candidatus Pacearchaeota archaeon]
MEDIFNDAAFDRWLYGGVHDLDEDVGKLIYNMYNLKKRFGFIKTNWSCSGHVGKWLIEGRSSMEGFWIYNLGLLGFEILNNNPNSENFMKNLSAIVEKYKFAELKHLPINLSDYWIRLEMKDIADNPKAKRDTKQFDFYWAENREIILELTQERYEVFKKFWNEMDGMVLSYLS